LRKAAAATDDDVEVVLTELLASNSAWQRNDDKYRQQRDRGALSGTAANEFAEYVAGLRHRALADCDRYQKLGGDPAEFAIDCGEPEVERDGPIPIALIPAPELAQTESEKDEALENEFRAIGSSMDTWLGRKQDDLRHAAEPNSQAPPIAFGGGGAVERDDGPGRSGQSSGSGAVDGQGSGGESTPKKLARRSGSVSGEYGAPIGKGKIGGVPPPKRQEAAPAGSGDDTLARQLREAAESETDPVLKDKLFEEYRKYKASIR
jgi:hypothetical protein